MTNAKQKMKSAVERFHRREEGMALLMVLGVVATAMVLIAHLMFFTQILSREAFQISRKTPLRYQAESAAETAFWLHLTDRRLFRNRNMGSGNDTAREESDFPSVMLDGRAIEFDAGRCTVWLVSGENGTKISRLQELKQGLDASDDATAIERIDQFIAAYQDYTDRDELTRVNGLEEKDYAELGFPTLPRNAAMTYKEELYWIPGWEEVLTGPICVVPPRGINYTFATSTKPSFFDASEQQFCQLLDIDAESVEMTQIREAIDAWRSNGVPIEESLDITLLTSVRSKFSFNEGGLAQCVVRASDAGGEIHAEYRVIRDARSGSVTFFADSKRECLSIWERRFQ